MSLKANNVSIDASVSARAIPKKAWPIFWCAALFYFYELVLRVSPSVMTNELMQQFGFTSAGSLGVLSSFYYYSYAALQIPCGIIVDKLGPRFVITISALLCTAGGFLFAYSDALWVAKIGRLLIGAGSACAFLSCLKIAAEWFPITKFVLLTGLTNAMGTFGGTFGGRPLAGLVSEFGWRDAMMIASAAGILMTVAAWAIIRNRPEQPVSGAQKPQEERRLLDGLKIVARSKQTWLVATYGCLMYLPISAFTELWAVPYLQQAYGVEREIASWGTAMLFIGMAIGSLIFTWMSEKMQSRRKAMAISAVCTALAFLALIFLPGLQLMYAFLILFIAGIMNGGQVLSFACAKEINPIQISGTTIGFTNMVIMMSGVVFQPFLGLVLDWVWDGVVDGVGVPIYSDVAYQTSLVTVPICLFLSFVILGFCKETFPKHSRGKSLLER